MKKFSALLLMIALAQAASLPSYADTQNKYKALNRQSRKAQEKEEKQMRKYAARQQKFEHKLNKSASKNKYKPVQPSPKQK